MNPLVTTEWLASRLRDSGTVILDATLPPVGITPPVDTRARYRARHIPGALFFDIDELSDHTTPLPHMLPTPDTFARSMAALGVGDRMTIVVYEQLGVFSAPRAWWMLRAFGAPNVFVLDGGLEAWLAAGLPTESAESKRPPSSFHAALDRAAVRDLRQVQHRIASLRPGAADAKADARGALSGQPQSVSHAAAGEHTGTAGEPAAAGQIVDARSAPRFTGTAPEPRPGISSGHMPGAINLPFTELAEAGRLKSSDQLRQLFAGKGIDLTQPITTTCGSGVTAAVLALGLQIAGANDVSLYDGSWAEYAQHPDAIIEKTAES